MDLIGDFDQFKLVLFETLGNKNILELKFNSVK